MTKESRKWQPLPGFSNPSQRGQKRSDLPDTNNNRPYKKHALSLPDTVIYNPEAHTLLYEIQEQISKKS